MADNDKIAGSNSSEEEYLKSILRIANFTDNFSDFMYHSIQVALKNSPQGMEHDEVKAFLTSLRKEISDFYSRVKSLRETFDI